MLQHVSRIGKFAYRKYNVASLVDWLFYHAVKKDKEEISSLLYQALIFRLTRHLKIALINKIKTYYFSNLKSQQRITVKFPCERVNEKYSRFFKNF